MDKQTDKAKCNDNHDNPDNLGIMDKQMDKQTVKAEH